MNPRAPKMKCKRRKKKEKRFEIAEFSLSLCLMRKINDH